MTQTMPMATTPSIRTFLDTITYEQTQGWFVVWSKKPGTSGSQSLHLPLPLPLSAESRILKLSLNQDVYFGLGVQNPKPPSGLRGEASTVFSIPGLWVDIDLATEKKPDRPESLQEAEAWAKTIPPQPTLLVASGNGLHAYWLFDKPWILPGPKDREQALLMTSSLQTYLRNEAPDWSLDSTSDLARVLRIPGTLNHKTSPPKEVSIIHQGPRHSLESLCRLLEPLKPTSAKTTLSPSPPVQRPSEAPRAASNRPTAYSRAQAWIATRSPAIEGQNGDRHTFTTACALMRGFELSHSDALHLIREWNQTCCPPWEDIDLESKLTGALKYGTEPMGYLLDKLTNGYNPQLKHEDEPPGLNNDPPDQSTTTLKTHKEPYDFPQTELGNAELMEYLYGEHLRHVVETYSWWVWRQSHWAQDAGKGSCTVPLAKAGEMARLRQEAAQELSNAPRQTLAGRPLTSLRAKEIAWAISSESNARQQAACTLLRARPALQASLNEMDSDPWILNCQNLTLNLKTGQTWEHKPEDFCSRVCGTVYDPHAKAPLWEKFIFDVMKGDQSLCEFLQRIAGYLLTGSVKEQCLFIFLGAEAGNGKSTWLDVMDIVLGDYATSTPPATFLEKDRAGEIPNALAALKGSRFVVCVEPDKKFTLSASIIKGVTGGDMINARFLNKEWFRYPAQFKLIMSVNHKPKVDGSDEGVWRRIHMIPWDQVFYKDGDGRSANTKSIKKADLDLKDKLLQEAPGILQWALQGLKIYLKHGLAAPAKVRTETKEYREEFDPIARFLVACCITDDPSGYEPVAKLHEAYQSWCDRNSRGDKLDVKPFGKALTRKGFESEKVREDRREIRIRMGIRLIRNDREVPEFWQD